MNVALLYPDAIPPSRKNVTDAGLDLYAYLADPIEIWPGDVQVIKTGVTVEIPVGCFGWITNKSRNNYLIGGGIVDQGYQGELLVKIENTTDEVVVINPAQAIAQLLIIPCQLVRVNLVDPKVIHSEKSERGGAGGIVGQELSIDEINWKLEEARMQDVEQAMNDYDFTEDDMNFDADRERRMFGRD